jgi:hypothetical protein
MTRGGPSAWGLGKELTTPHSKKPTCYKILHGALELNGGTSDELL